MSFTASLEQVIGEDRSGLLETHPTWERVELAQVASILNGFAFSSSHFRRDEGVPLLRIRDLTKDSTEARYNGEFDSKYLVERDQLVVGMDGDFNSALWSGPTALLNQRVCRIDPDERFYDKRFLSYALPGYLAAIHSRTSSVTVKHLSSKTVAKIPLPLPPLQEQRRIVAEIEKHWTRLDAAVMALKRAQANLDRYRTSVLQAACEGRLSPANVQGLAYESLDSTAKPAHQEASYSRTSDLPRLPRDWHWSVLGEFIEEIRAGKNFKCEERPPENDEVGVVKVSAVTWGYFDELASKTCTRPDLVRSDLFICPGDFLISRANTIELVGACVIASSFERTLMLSDKVLRLNLVGLPKGWLLYVLRSPHGRREIQRLATGNQESMRNISQASLRKIRIPVPPASKVDGLVAEIQRRLSLLDDVALTVRTEIDRAEHLKHAILKRAFEGKLLPQDPTDEPASVLLERIRQEREAIGAPAKGRSHRTRSSTGRRTVKHG